MQIQLYLFLGILIGFIYTLAAATITFSLIYRRKPNDTTLGDLRNRLSKINDDICKTEQQIWDYGSSEEEKARRWRIAYTAIAGKAVDVLRSCWLGRETDATSNAIYDELLVGLKSVGLIEIYPNLGQEVSEDDRHYRFKEIAGYPPYKVSKLISPGYYLKPTSSKTTMQEEIILEPALIEVIGERKTEDTDKPPEVID